MSYSDDDAIFDENDDDVFKPADSTEAPSSSGGFRVAGYQIPGYLRSALERYISENPEIKDSFQGYQDLSAMMEFITVFSMYDTSLYHFHPRRFRWTDASLRALLHVVNNSTEGLVQRIALAYSIEGKLQMLHSNHANVITLSTGISSFDHPPTKLSISMLAYLGTLADIYSFSIESLAQKYADACDLAEIDQDIQLVKYGIQSEGDFAYASTTSMPQLSLHYSYGDVSSIGNATEDSFRHTFIKFLLPIIFGDESTASELMNDRVHLSHP